jgi:prepilin-type processing-associated H-X9-DG protein
MEENYVGFLLNALDPDSQREVEEHLDAHPEARRQVELLRQALDPLEADRADIEPPPGLAIRTLACVAEYCCRDLPRAPVPPQRWTETGSTRWWRRADVLVAASVLLGAMLLLPPLVTFLHRQHHMMSCRNNLRQFGEALVKYSMDHKDAFPDVAHPEGRDAKEPLAAERRIAGLFIPILIEAGMLKPDEVSVRCPGNPGPSRSAWSLSQLKKMSNEEFKDVESSLAGCYAYTLGYQTDRGGVRGCCKDDLDLGPVPIASDKPVREDILRSNRGDNSRNHGGSGQNVLFSDGHVAFLTSRKIGGDDIFLNGHKRVAAGLDNRDVVLGASDARPKPVNVND